MRSKQVQILSGICGVQLIGYACRAAGFKTDIWIGFAMCGNIVLDHENETRFCVEILFQLLNLQTCLTESLDDRIKEVRKYYTEENGPESIRYGLSL